MIFLTENNDLVTLEKIKQIDHFGYMVKPFEERKLHITVEIALARWKAEREIRKSLEKEKELNELKSRLISMISHQFRTPLSTTLFSADLLETFSAEWPEEKRKTHIHRIQNAVHRMTELLDDVLLVEKAEAGKLEFNPAPMDLEAFCHKIVKDIQITDDQHKFNFVSQGVCITAHLDEKLLRYILSNLLSNASKYSHRGGTVLFELACETHHEHGAVVIFRIQDQGIGIPKEDQERLFENFHRAKNVGTIPGTGLGLTIVKRSVELHGGQITVESEVGVGTTFSVMLPLQSSCLY